MEIGRYNRNNNIVINKKDRDFIISLLNNVGSLEEYHDTIVSIFAKMEIKLVFTKFPDTFKLVDGKYKVVGSFAGYTESKYNKSFNDVITWDCRLENTFGMRTGSGNGGDYFNYWGSSIDITKFPKWHNEFKVQEFNEKYQIEYDNTIKNIKNEYATNMTQYVNSHKDVINAGKKLSACNSKLIELTRMLRQYEMLLENTITYHKNEYKQNNPINIPKVTSPFVNMSSKTDLQKFIDVGKVVEIDENELDNKFKQFLSDNPELFL